MSGPAPITVKELSDSGVVITGGSSGVGLAAAEHLVAAGVPRVMLIGRDEARGSAACDQVRSVAPDARVSFLSADCNDPVAAAAAVDRAATAVGGIDVLVNATAAAFVPDLLYDIPVNDIPAILAQQALAPLVMTRLVLPAMRRQRGGVVVNVASDAAKVPTPGESVIGAAMAAIVTFSRTVAMEAKRDGIRVNALTPSLIQGTLTAERILRGGFSAKLFRKAGSLAHLGVSTTADQAALIVYLASPQAARLTGQAISLNGGISAA